MVSYYTKNEKKEKHKKLIMTIIQKFTKRKKKVFAYIRFIIHSKCNDKNKKTAYIAMHQIEPNRRLYHICSYLQESGYNCFVNISFRQFFSMDLYGLKAILLPHVYSSRGVNRIDAELVVTDDKKITSGFKTLILDYSVFDRQTDYSKSLFYPIHFHPDFMNKESEKTAIAKSHEARKRHISVFFAGNCDQESYNSSITVNYFNIHTRWDIFHFLLENINQENLYIPTNYNEFCLKRNNGELIDKIVLIDINRFKIPQSDWFDILTDSDYFIHLPGYIQPWCHNQIESIASGAIPIIEYPGLFHPALENMMNAVAYKSKADLMDRLNEILSGSITDNKKEMLRSNISSYYLNNFSFNSFTSSLQTFNESSAFEKKLYVCAGDFSMQATSKKSEVST